MKRKRRDGDGRRGRRLGEILFGRPGATGEPELRRVREHMDRLEELIHGLREPEGELAEEPARHEEPEDELAEEPAEHEEPAQPEEPVERPTEPAAEQVEGHVLFYRSEGAYAVREEEGPCPQPGEHVEGQVVLRVGPSPLPGDRRLCAFLEPEASQPE